MIKKISVVFLVLLLVLGSAAPGYCYGPVRKLERGIWNLITWPAEIPHRINERSKDSGLIEGATIGLIEGIVTAVFRGGIGMYETAFFFLPVPEKYEPIMKDPEFFFIKVPDDKK